jgi:plastocyanin
VRWKIPSIFFAVPWVLAGILVPALIVQTPRPAPPQTVGMSFMDFSVESVTIHRGDRLTLVNSSRNIHAIGPGQNGQVTSPVPGEPLTGYHMLETNDRYTTGPWMVPGTYYITCSVHPDMNLKVVVRP